MYKSPIDVMIADVQHQIAQQQDEEIYKAVVSVGINVDKEELVRALRYDRYQYAKGYADGTRDAEQKWIPVTERLPEERDSIFTSFYGTAKWQDGMFLKCSDTVLASVEYEDGKRRVKAIITKDGKWDLSKMYRASKVTHWMPLPEPPKGE
jgi:hypothetical protein